MKALALASISFYQRAVSPFVMSSCRYGPHMLPLLTSSYPKTWCASGIVAFTETA